MRTLATAGASTIVLWPDQVLAYALAVVVVLLAVQPFPYSSRIISFCLALGWVWMGISYHVLNFAYASSAAYWLGVLLVAQGLVFFGYGVLFPRLVFEFRLNKTALVGVLFVVYVLVFYPLLGYLFANAYPQGRIFGLPALPTIVFTFGILLWTIRPVPWGVVVIPTLWSLIGFGVYALSAPVALASLTAAFVGSVVIVLNNGIRWNYWTPWRSGE